MTIAVVVISGGMDSTVLAHDLDQKGHDLRLLSVDYGQRHRKELDYAAATAARLKAPHIVADLSGVTGLLGGSALTSPDVAVPAGHYAEESMAATVVPNRNAIMLNIAAGYAITQKAQIVATAVHAGDHHIYPDCRPRFIRSLNEMLSDATEGHSVPGFRVAAPYVEWSKTDIAQRGQELGVDFTETWSCYQGGDIHCGVCGTCVERIEALAQVGDPTEYADKQFALDTLAGANL